MMSRFNSIYNSVAYRKETYYMLDHFSLKVKNPEVKRELVFYRLKQMEKVFPMLGAINLLPILINCFNLFKNETGHPLMIILSMIVCILISFIKVLATLKKPGYAAVCVYAYIYVMCISTALVYMDWIPNSLKGDKLYF